MAEISDDTLCTVMSALRNELARFSSMDGRLMLAKNGKPIIVNKLNRAIAEVEPHYNRLMMAVSQRID